MLNPEYEKIGSDILNCAYYLRNTVGRGLRECYYRDALAILLKRKGYSAETEVLVPAIFEGEEIAAAYKADIIVNGQVVIEIKAITCMSEPEVRQLLTYMRLSTMKLGYLINFGAMSFRFGRIKEGQPYNM